MSEWRPWEESVTQHRYDRWIEQVADNVHWPDHEVRRAMVEEVLDAIRRVGAP